MCDIQYALLLQKHLSPKLTSNDEILAPPGAAQVDF